jgi:hypothetical protein
MANISTNWKCSKLTYVKDFQPYKMENMGKETNQIYPGANG